MYKSFDREKPSSIKEKAPTVAPEDVEVAADDVGRVAAQRLRQIPGHDRLHPGHRVGFENVQVVQVQPAGVPPEQDQFVPV